MSVMIQFGTPGDIPRIIDCADRCFGFTTPETSFRAVGAKFYGDQFDHAKDHLLVTIDNHLAGLVGLCPETMQIGEQTLSMIGIGTVSTLPEFRGKGVMQLMLNRCNQVFAEQDCDLAFLAGLYHRYHHFGYELGGTTYQYTVKKSATEQPYKMRLIQPNDACLQACLDLHDTEAVRVNRTLSEFYGLLTQWKREPYAIFDGTGQLIGYLSYHDENTCIEELFLNDYQVLQDVLETAMTAFSLDQIKLELPAYRTELCKALDGMGEKIQKPLEIMLQIRHFAKFIAAFLPLQPQLEDGSMVLDVTGKERMAITVKDGAVSVVVTDEPADITLDWTDATKLLFGALETETIPSALQVVCKSWFPLPFSLAYGDQF